MNRQNSQNSPEARNPGPKVEKPDPGHQAISVIWGDSTRRIVRRIAEFFTRPIWRLLKTIVFLF